MDWIVVFLENYGVQGMVLAVLTYAIYHMTKTLTERDKMISAMETHTAALRRHTDGLNVLREKIQDQNLVIESLAQANRNWIASQRELATAIDALEKILKAKKGIK